MGTPMQNSANSVLNALDEGQVMGAIYTIEYYSPNISKKEVADVLRKVFHYWNSEDLEYWIDWFGLNK